MNSQSTRSDKWGVLMAGGDGTRLQSLTGRIEGDARPKQFCRLLGDETLLAQTRRRIEPLFPARNIMTVVAADGRVLVAGGWGPCTAVCHGWSGGSRAVHGTYRCA